MKRRAKSTPRALGELVPRVLDELGLEAAQALARLCQRWEAIVGAETARHAQPAGLRGPVLEVAAESSAWCHALVLRREEILAALAAELGDDAPRELWLRVR